MTVGVAPRQADLLRGSAAVCEGRVSPDSIWAVLHRECHRLFPDEMFADLFSDRGRRSVPPRVVAVVMVLQRLFGLSDREAVEAFSFDARWKYAAGGLDFDYPGFAHTVLVDMRARLDASADKERIFNVTVEAARQAGLVGVRRVLDSTPLYDAVATMDTVTLVRSALRGLLAVADEALEAQLRAVLTSGDDYASAAKPRIDWDDAPAREALVGSRAKDARACLAVLDGRELAPAVAQAARLLANVVGQDLEQGDDGVLRIARRVAADRVVSTVDPDARHGPKTAARGFDGYKGHAAVDPDSEIITATKVTPGNAGDATVAAELIADLLADKPAGPEAIDDTTTDDTTTTGASPSGDGERAKVYGDSAYGSGELQSVLEKAGIDSGCKTQAPTAPGGCFAKDLFDIDLDAGTVTCPGEVTVTIRRARDATGTASFGGACATCPLRAQCTTSPKGRTIRVGRHEAVLARARHRQADPAWPRTTGPRGPRSNASSATSCAGATVGEGPGSGDGPRSTPTSGCSPPPSTWRASPCPVCARPRPDGPWVPHDGDFEGPGPSGGTMSTTSSLAWQPTTHRRRSTKVP